MAHQDDEQLRDDARVMLDAGDYDADAWKIAEELGISVDVVLQEQTRGHLDLPGVMARAQAAQAKRRRGYRSAELRYYPEPS